MAASSPQPAAIGAFVGGVIAATMLFQRRLRIGVILASALVACLAAGIFWELLAALGAAPWSTVADAALGPMIAVVTAWLWGQLRRG